MKFSIRGNQLALSDPADDPYFAFQRKVNPVMEADKKSIEGSWLIQSAGDLSIGHLLTVDSAVMVGCSGAIFSYKTSGNYSIQVKI